ncbi:MAG: hypothetical protein DMG33_00250 [Acidobacteria bacterium]|nr:MAG: hypothetical protein DMG33_00250 [Acidobacteriota bacterium]
MDPRREQALVGLFVLVAAGVLIFTVFTLTGGFRGSAVTYRANFPFAGGLEPGATVRYAGGPKVGRVEQLRLNPKDPARIEITFSVQAGTPVKTDSVVKIMSLSPLGENHLEITPGSAQAGAAPSGSLLRSEPYVDFNAITGQLNALGPKVAELVSTLNDRASELKETVTRVNDLLNTRNRANLGASLGHVRGMLEEDRPRIKSSLEHVDTAAAKLSPLLDDFRKTVADAQQALQHADAMIGEDRPELRQALKELQRALVSAQSVTGQLDRTLDANSENVDELLENLRHTSENLKEFTDTIKSRPSSLLRSSAPKDPKP